MNDQDDVTEERYDAGKDGQTSHLNQNVGKDAFGFSLHYYEGDYASVSPTADDDLLVDITNTTFGDNTHDLYNGNIHQMVTSINDIDENGLGVLANKYRYDQLQRIKKSNVFEGSDIRENNQVTTVGATDNGNWSTEYTFDGNGNLLTLTRKDGSAAFIDDFSYHYNYNPHTYPELPDGTADPDYIPGAVTTNQLTYLSDAIGTVVSTVDVDDQTSDNYSYDAIGQLIQDKSNDISSIEWTVTGKVKKITYDNDLNPDVETNVDFVEFSYDAMGNRISKWVHYDYIIPAETTGPDELIIEDEITYYMLDASGNVLATYQHYIDYPEYPGGPTDPESVKLNDHTIYGSKRLGVATENLDMTASMPGMEDDDYNLFNRILGQKAYELSNHLGNVLATVSDRKIANGAFLESGDVTYYDADVLSHSEYYPYGMTMPGRSGTDGSSYRYGFQGQEMDDEIKGEGNSVNYKYRMHDPRIGRFFAVDPLAPQYPHNSPYAFSENSTIAFVELEGLERFYAADGGLIYSGGTDDKTPYMTDFATVGEGEQFLNSNGNFDTEIWGHVTGTVGGVPAGPGVSVFVEYDIKFTTEPFTDDKGDGSMGYVHKVTDTDKELVSRTFVNDGLGRRGYIYNVTAPIEVSNHAVQAWGHETIYSWIPLTEAKKFLIGNVERNINCTWCEHNESALWGLRVGILANNLDGIVHENMYFTSGVSVSASNMDFTEAERASLRKVAGDCRVRIVNGEAIIDRYSFYNNATHNDINNVMNALRNNGATSVTIYTNSANSTMTTMLNSRMAFGRDFFGLTISKRTIGYVLTGNL